MIVSLFSHARDNEARQLPLTWEQLCASLSSHVVLVTDDKRNAPMWSPATFLDGIRRKNKALEVSCGVLDLDDVTGDQVQDVLNTLATLGWASHWYTTWSIYKAWRAGVQRWRVVIPFDRPVRDDEWPLFWTAWASLWSVTDTQDCDISRGYFGAFVPEGTPAELCLSQTYPGRAIDVESFLRRAKEILADAEHPAFISTQKLQRQMLRRVGIRLMRRSSVHDQDMAQRIYAICRGESFAQEPHRDEVLFRICSILVRNIPGASAASLADLFVPSIQLMAIENPNKPLTIETVKYKLERAIERYNAENDQEKADNNVNQKARIREAFRPEDRDYPYDQTEYNRFLSEQQCTPGEFKHRWIIQHGDSYYIYKAGTYHLYSKLAVRNATVRDLSPASTLGVELYAISSQGITVRRQVDELVEYYGSVAKSAEIHFTAQRSYYDADRFVMVEASAPLDERLEPHMHQEIDTWLRLLGGEKYYLLEKWLSWVLELNRPLAALLITDAAGAGKSLLANGIARIWNRAPTPMSSVMSSFNDVFMRCPLVFADEQLPADFRGTTKTTELREFIQAREHVLRRKFIPDARLIGCARVIVAANSKAILEIKADLGAHDADAIAERFIHITADERPVEYLKTVGTERVSQWIEDGMIAEHVMYLNNKARPEKSEGRFLVRDSDDNTVRALITRTGLRGVLCRWLVSYLLNPRPIDSQKQYHVRVYRRQLLVNVRGLELNWDIYEPGEKRPGTRVLSDAAKALSYKVRARIGNEKYLAIDIRNLIAWAQETEFAPPEQFLPSLETDSEDKIKQFMQAVLH